MKLPAIYHNVEFAAPSKEFSEIDITLIPVLTILRKGVAIAPRYPREVNLLLELMALQ
jgi:hypothetical protein